MYVGVEVSLETLTLLKWRGQDEREQTFRLVSKVSLRWMEFGLRVKIERDLLKSWCKKFQGDSVDCWCEVMEHWINTDGKGCDYPVTWDGLYSMLDDLEYCQVARDLKTAITACSASQAHPLDPTSMVTPLPDAASPAVHSHAPTSPATPPLNSSSIATPP